MQFPKGSNVDDRHLRIIDLLNFMQTMSMRAPRDALSLQKGEVLVLESETVVKVEPYSINMPLGNNVRAA